MRSVVIAALLALGVLVSIFFAPPPIFAPNPPSQSHLVFPAGEKAPKTGHSAYKYEYQNKDRDFFDWANMALTLVFTGIVALYSRRLYFATKRATDATVDALGESKCANELAAESSRAARVAAEAGIAAERAWVLTDGPVRLWAYSLREEEEEEICKGAQIGLKNFGKTPALSVVVRTELFHSKEANPPPRAEPSTLAYPVVGVLGAGEALSRSEDNETDPCSADCNLTKAQWWQGVKERNGWLMLDATILYRDVFGGKRRTYVRYIYQPPSDEFELLTFDVSEEA